MLAKLAHVSGSAPKLLVTVKHFALIASIAAIQDVSTHILGNANICALPNASTTLSCG